MTCLLQPKRPGSELRLGKPAQRQERGDVVYALDGRPILQRHGVRVVLSADLAEGQVQAGIDQAGTGSRPRAPVESGKRDDVAAPATPRLTDVESDSCSDNPASAVDSDFGPRASGLGPQTSDFRPRTSDLGLQTNLALRTQSSCDTPTRVRSQYVSSLWARCKYPVR